jgi:putative hydrolase of the HAD superfamily
MAKDRGYVDAGPRSPPGRATMLPRAILFDLDDTILSAHARPELAWPVVAAHFADALNPLTVDELAAAVIAVSRVFWADATHHAYWRMRLAEARRAIVATALARLAEAGRPVPPADVGDRLADRFSAYREEQMCLFPDALVVIDTLRSLGVRLALVTNGAAEIQRGKIARFDLAHRFDHIQIEGEHGFGKPDERAYRHAMRALDVEPHETWMVGDNLEWEVVAPQRLGIHAIWHDVFGEGLPLDSTIRPDRIIRRLTELLPGAASA